MKVAAWVALGALGGALAALAISQPTQEGCCRALAVAARDKIADGTGRAAPIVAWLLDATGITARLPRLVQAAQAQGASHDDLR